MRGGEGAHEMQPGQVCACVCVKGGRPCGDGAHPWGFQRDCCGTAVGAQPPGEQQAARLGVPVSCTLFSLLCLCGHMLSPPPSSPPHRPPFLLPFGSVSAPLPCTLYPPLPSLPPFLLLVLLPQLSSPSSTQLCIILSQQSVFPSISASSPSEEAVIPEISQRGRRGRAGAELSVTGWAAALNEAACCSRDGAGGLSVCLGPGSNPASLSLQRDDSG